MQQRGEKKASGRLANLLGRGVCVCVCGITMSAEELPLVHTVSMPAWRRHGLILLLFGVGIYTLQSGREIKAEG